MSAPSGSSAALNLIDNVAFVLTLLSLERIVEGFFFSDPAPDMFKVKIGAVLLALSYGSNVLGLKWSNIVRRSRSGSASFLVQHLWRNSQLQIWRDVSGGKGAFKLETTVTGRVESRCDAPINIKEIRVELLRRSWLRTTSVVARSNYVSYFRKQEHGKIGPIERLDLSQQPIRVEPHGTSGYFVFRGNTPLPQNHALLNGRYIARIHFIVTGNQATIPIDLPMLDGFGPYQAINYDDDGMPSLGDRAVIAAAQQAETAEAAKQSPPSQRPATLRELFENDWPNLPGYYSESTLESRAFQATKIKFAWRLNGDFVARSKFFAFFLEPAVSAADAQTVCEGIADQYQEFIDTANSEIDMSGQALGDTSATHLKDMIFSKRVFVYYQNPDFSLAQKGAIESLYKSKGLSIQFRDTSYQWLHRDERGFRPQPLVPNSVLLPDTRLNEGVIIAVSNLKGRN